MYLYSLFGYKIDGCQMKNVAGKIISKENSYLLALGSSSVKKTSYSFIVTGTSFCLKTEKDGDVDFDPIDFELVLARMVRNPDVAACCNQIHPQGSGPLGNSATTKFLIQFSLVSAI